jgi:signal transduction histidine kinase
MSTLFPDAEAAAAHPGEAQAPTSNGRTRFAFLAETSRCLANSLDFETTLATGAGLALPYFGTWCMVDIVETDGTIRRVAVIHPDAGKQRQVREFYDAHPPGPGDPLGAARVIRTLESEFVLAYDDDVLEGIAEEEHRLLLQELGARSFLMVPMLARGRTLGAITFVSDHRREYDDADLLLAEDLGRRCAMAVDNACLYAASEEARRAAEEAREAATLTALRAEELLDEANLARYEAETANRARTAFLGTISHEFRTPLTAVQGFTDLLMAEAAGPLNEKQLHNVRRIRGASDHLLTLIGEILTFAQQQSGRSELRLREVDLTAVVREAATIVKPLAAAKGLSFPLRVPDGPIPFHTDAGKVRLIILNLAANAVKFTETGEVRLELELEDGAPLLRVGDTGMGIAPEHAERVFDPFWQVDQSNARVGGTGLGLAVARQLAGLLGGELTMESEPGRGSEFTVRLPVVPAASAAPAEDVPAGDSSSEQRIKGRRIGHRRGVKPVSSEPPAEEV